MKKLLCFLTALLTIFALCACSFTVLPPKATPTPAPTPTSPPTELDVWLARAEARYNMQYADFAEYWSLMCDELYGDDLLTVLSAVDLSAKDAEVAAKRTELADKYGADWHYAVADCRQEALNEKACKDFKGELKDIAKRAAVLTKAAKSWSESDWADFAAAHDCTADKAKAVVSAVGAIGDICREATVTKAVELTLTLGFTGSKAAASTVDEVNTVYLVNGVYVSEMLLDYSYALLNLVC